MASNRDLTHVKSLKDLQAEILNVRAGLIIQEVQLKERAKKIPMEAGQAALGKVLPFVLTSGALGKSWSILRGAAGLISIFRGQKKGGVKTKLVNTAKRVGVSAAIKGVFNFIKNRKKSPQKIQVP